MTEVGASVEHVVRTRMFVTDASFGDAVGRAHGEAMGAARPAATMVVVKGLLDERWKVEKLDDGPPGKGTRYRYHLDLGGHKEKLEVEQDVYNKPKKCSGRFIKGPLNGTWSYTYTQRKDGSTRLVYDMDYQLGGLLRFATGVLGPQYAAGIRENMEALKRYIESGEGPAVKK